MTTFEWDAPTYNAIPLPHVQWGSGVLQRLEPQPGELLLDLGCGPGRDVERLLTMRPGVQVVGVDGSAKMLAEFDRRFAGQPAVRSVRADLTEPLTPDRIGLSRPADGIFSVACFHWVQDHAALFRNVAALLRPGGRLVAECGGAGNVRRVSEAIAAVKGAEPEHWTFEDVDATLSNLECAGLVVDDVRLRPDPLLLSDRDELETYLAAVVLGKELALMPADGGRAYVSAVARRLAGGTIDYERLEIEAHRPG